MKFGQEEQQGSTNGAQSPQKDKNIPQPPVQAATPILNPNTASQTETKTSEVPDSENPNPSDERIVWFTGILAAVAVVQLIVLGYQIWTTRSTSQKELRAYVLPVAATRRIENGSPTPMLKIIIHNSGKTPAINCVSGVFRGIATATKPLPPLPPIDKESLSRSDSFIASGGEVWMIDADVLSPQEETDIRNGVRAIYAFGTITYEDVFKAKHTTDYKFMCVGENLAKGTFVFYDEGNRIT